MKKISLKNIKNGLTRSELKSIMGGSGTDCVYMEACGTHRGYWQSPSSISCCP